MINHSSFTIGLEGVHLRAPEGGRSRLHHCRKPYSRPSRGSCLPFKWPSGRGGADRSLLLESHVSETASA